VARKSTLVAKGPLQRFGQERRQQLGRHRVKVIVAAGPQPYLGRQRGAVVAQPHADQAIMAKLNDPPASTRQTGTEPAVAIPAAIA
jgi:hypothetical protein